MKALKNNITTAGTFIAAVVGHHYVSKLLEYRNEMASAREQEIKDLAANENMENLKTTLNSVTKSMHSLEESVSKLYDKQVPEAALSAVQEKLDIENNNVALYLMY